MDATSLLVLGSSLVVRTIPVSCVLAYGGCVKRQLLISFPVRVH